MQGSGGSTGARSAAVTSSQQTLSASGAAADSRGGRRSPAKQAAGVVQATLSGYQERLLQLTSSLHAATRPQAHQQTHSRSCAAVSSCMDTSALTASPDAVSPADAVASECPVFAGGSSTGIEGLQLQPLEAVPVGGPRADSAGLRQLWPCAGSPQGLCASPLCASPAGKPVCAAAHAEWRVIGQPRRSNLGAPQQTGRGQSMLSTGGVKVAVAALAPTAGT